MLHRLEIENFYSIRERQVIDLRAAANAPEDNDRLAPLWKGSTERAPKVVALFGANASGKSNVLRALMFLSWFVSKSFAQNLDAQLPYDSFASVEGREAPTRFTVYMSGLADPLGDIKAEAQPNCRYVYRLEIGRWNEVRQISTATPQVIYEALHYWPNQTGRQKLLFERRVGVELRTGKAFDVDGYNLNKFLAPNASLISSLARIGHPYASTIAAATSKIYGNIILQKSSASDEQVTQIYEKNDDLMNAFRREVRHADLGISDIVLVPNEKGKEALFVHSGLDMSIPVYGESEGTRQFWKIYPHIYAALNYGGIAVLDELDSAIHPTLLREILDWFYSPVKNSRNAQIWMTCHNASLLEDMAKEEVFFCNKDSKGQTEVYGLKDITAVRREDNYYKKYLGGVYGAVPHIG